MKPDHNEVPYEFEETNDPNEWKYVERLLPVLTVPEVKPKPVYPSGWRPQTGKCSTLLTLILNEINQ